MAETAYVPRLRTQYDETIKAALKELGVIDSAFVRLPLVESPPEHLEIMRKGLTGSGIA